MQVSGKAYKDVYCFDQTSSERLPHVLKEEVLRFAVNLQMMVTYSIHLYSRNSHISFCVSFLSRVDELNKLAGLQCMGLHSSG